MLIPAIDIIDGHCVRLSQGDYSKQSSYSESPLDMALKFADAGITRLHLVDLDGAKAGAPANLATLELIASKTSLDIEYGGGIKSERALKNVFNAGGTHAIIGSLAVKNPQLTAQWLTAYGGDKIILGADVRDGKVAVSGWLEDSQYTADTLIEVFSPYGLKEVIVTDISKDGMLEGPSTQLYLDLKARHPGILFTVSGGISSMEDIENLYRLGLDHIIIGKAIYEGKITLPQISAFLSSSKS